MQSIKAGKTGNEATNTNVQGLHTKLVLITQLSNSSVTHVRVRPDREVPPVQLNYSLVLARTTVTHVRVRPDREVPPVQLNYS